MVKAAPISINWPWLAMPAGTKRGACWPTAPGTRFSARIGRLDLAAAAKQAVKEPDLDVGLSQLLEKFPADPNALRRPQLSLPSTEENLGALTPGTDHRFELVITNRGLLVLRGMATTNCEWLSLGDGAGAALKMFQTRGIYTLPVRVLGNKLRAGAKPLQGEIVIDTNGGTITLPVRADVPVRPFPSGTHANDVLAGARSPRELAVKAKANPLEAAVLFEQGAVKAWYASNGWTYPVEGTQASGKAAVQQFFEALGLTKPPRLEIDTERLLCKGKVGPTTHEARDDQHQRVQGGLRPGLEQSALDQSGAGKVSGQQSHDTVANRGPAPSGGNGPRRRDDSGQRQTAVCRARDPGGLGRSRRTWLPRRRSRPEGCPWVGFSRGSSRRSPARPRGRRWRVRHESRKREAGADG